MEFLEDEEYLARRNQFPFIGNLENGILKLHTPVCPRLQRAIDEEKDLLSYRKFGFHSLAAAQNFARQNGWEITVLCRCM